MRWLYSVWICSLAGGLCVVGLCGCAKPASSALDTQAINIKVNQWSGAVKSTDKKTRLLALNHLGNYSTAAPEVFALVAGALKDPDPDIRREAIRNLWKFDKQENEALAALSQVKDNDADPKIKADAEKMIKAIQERQAAAPPKK
jgi:HEAT repeat protein